MRDTIGEREYWRGEMKGMSLAEAKGFVQRYSEMIQWESDRPYTLVRIRCQLGDQWYIERGWAKWNPNDEGVDGLDWSETRGLAIAKGRAIRRLAKRLGELSAIRWQEEKLERDLRSAGWAPAYALKASDVQAMAAKGAFTHDYEHANRIEGGHYRGGEG